MGHGKGANAVNRWRLNEWEVLHQICLTHGIEISEPKKSRGYSYTTQEYGEHQDKIRELEAEKEKIMVKLNEVRSTVDKAAKKKVKIDDIESIEAKESMFGKKVTLSKTDFEKLNDTARKHVAMEKTTKNLKSDKTALLQKVAELEKQVNLMSAELDEYKKSANVSIIKTLETNKKRSDLEEALKKYQKAVSFIESHGLLAEYEQYRKQSNTRNNIL